MTEKILFVDDEPHILSSYQRVLRNQFVTQTAEGGEQGLEAVRIDGPFAVIVSDMRMPGMDGAQFLARVRQLAPDSVRIMLTGNADQQTAVDAVNDGQIFRFLSKPCPADNLAKTLGAAIRQYRLVTAEKELLEKTLSGGIKVLTDLLSLVNPVAFSRASQLREYVRHIVARLSIENAWQYEIAALLSQIGCVTLPPETLEAAFAGECLPADEQGRYDAHPRIAANLLANIPRFESLSKMIARQGEPFSEQLWPPDPKARDESTLGAHVLRVALEFDLLVRRGATLPQAIEQLRGSGSQCDPALVATLSDIRLPTAETFVRLVKLDELAGGMMLDEEIRTSNSMLLVAKGQELTYALIARLQNFWLRGVITDQFHIRVPVEPRQPGPDQTSISTKSVA